MSPQSSASPAFAPNSFLHGGLQSPTFGASVRPPGIFGDSSFGRLDAVALGGSDSPMRDAFAGGSRMFDELTNQDDGAEGPKGEKRSPRVGAADEKAGGGGDAAKWGGDEDMDLFFDGP